MKILYAIQGTGNGHLSRARDIIPILENYGDLDLLVSSTHAEVKLPYKIKYEYKGLGFVFGKNGGIDYVETYKKSNIKKFFKEIKELPAQEYDLVISDFEPVSAWACYLKNKPCIGLSHQTAVSNKHSPKPQKKDVIGSAILQFYAPAQYNYGFHFLPYDHNIFTPVIRKEVRALQPSDERHYTVYLPAYSDKRIIKFLSLFPKTRWQVFSKNCKKPFQEGNISICPVSNEAFLRSMATATGVLCGAGFETPAEVLYLEKKLLVIPMKGQYEQQCNAAALKKLGVPVLKSLKLKRQKEVVHWLENSNRIMLDCPDDTEVILENIIHDYSKKGNPQKISNKIIDTSSKFRNVLLKKIFYQPASK